MAEKQHGLRYINFIGDRDSSVHTTLISGVPGWGHAITTQECANHVVKCFFCIGKPGKRQTQLQGQTQINRGSTETPSFISEVCNHYEEQ